MHGDSLPSEGLEVSLAGLHVLVLEGAAGDGEFVCALERRGASVTPVGSTQDAIEALAQSAGDAFVTVVLAEPVEPEDLVSLVAGCRRRRALVRERRLALSEVRESLRAQRERILEQREALADVRHALDRRRTMRLDARSVEGNRILAALPVEALRAALAECSAVRAGMGHVLCWPGTQPSAVHFPLTSVVSLTCELSSGDATEVGMLGFEGVVGADMAFGAATSSHRATVVVAGDVLTMPVATFARVYDEEPAFRAAINAFEHELFRRVAQTAACNNFHTIEQRVARWLLAARRLGRSSEIAVTHGLIARLLGVRRAGVTVALGDLERRGLVRCGRGHLHVDDEAGLRDAACECDAALDESRRNPDGRRAGRA